LFRFGFAGKTEISVFLLYTKMLKKLNEMILLWLVQHACSLTREPETVTKQMMVFEAALMSGLGICSF